MKHLKKITAITIITILLIIFSTYVIMGADTYDKRNNTYDERNTDLFVICGFNYNEDEGKKVLNIKYDLNNDITLETREDTTTKKEITGVEIVHNATQIASNGQISILNLPNVWCVQCGKNLDNAFFGVSDTYYVDEDKGDKHGSDPILAYILSNGPAMGKLQGEGKKENEFADKSQVALWLYLEGIKYGDIMLSETEFLKDDEGKKITFTNSDKTYHTNTILSGIDDEVARYYGGRVKGDEKGAIQMLKEALEYKNSLSSQSTIYKAQYKLLKNDNQQRILVGGGNGTEVKADVSLQKYITKVNGNDLTESETTLTNRKNKKAEATSNEKISKSNTATGNCKNYNIVSIEAGDIVTYRIEVYNNSSVNASSVTIKDTLPGIIYDGKKEPPYGITIESIYQGTSNITNDVTIEKDKNSIEITTTNLPAHTSRIFDIKIKFNEYKTNTLTNTASIIATTPNNNTSYRTTDSDYVQMKQYSVSLEKYITQVSDKDGNNVINVTDREGKRYNDAAKDKSNLNNYNDYKLKNKIEVEPGDKVTFTIKLTNTGNTNVKISQIYDTFTFYEEETLNGLKLVYDTSYGIKGNGDGKIEDYHYTDDKDNANKKLDRYLIQFNKSVLLDTSGDGASTYVTIRFDVEVPSGLTNVSRSLSNISGIVTLKNKNDVKVNDSDGTDNNRDQDYLITKTYAVSLEKYVSDVNTIYKDEPGYDAKFDYNEDGAVNLKDVVAFRQMLASNGGYNEDREGKAEHKDDDDIETDNNWKYDNVVKVAKGDTVIYTIKVTNNGDTKAIITKIADYLPNGVEYEGKEYKGDVYCTEWGEGQTENEISFTEKISLEPGESKYFAVEVKVIESNISLNIMKNVAEIKTLENKNGIAVKDTTENDNKDADYIQMEKEEEKEETVDYGVKKVWDITGGTPSEVKVKLFKIEAGEEKDYGKEDVILSDKNDWTYKWEKLPKYDSSGNAITYVARELRADGTVVADKTIYSDGVTASYSTTTTTTTITNTGNITPPPLEKTSYSVTKVWQDDSNPSRPTSIRVALFKKVGDRLEKVGSDIELNSRSWSYTWTDLDEGVEYLAKELKDGSPLNEGQKLNDDYTVSYKHEVNKTTIYNTKPTETPSTGMSIAGFVWNDMALDKTENIYNGLKDEEESYLSGITVELYRVGRDKAVATTTTDVNGAYSFTDSDLDSSIPVNERYIKGPKVAGTDRWVGTYYKYKIEFKYDGIKYTSTNKEHYLSMNSLCSNAEEDGAVREEFNKEFLEVEGSTIKGSKGNHTIEYSTVNEEGYIPQSIYKYDSTWMAVISYVDVDLDEVATSIKTLETEESEIESDIFDCLKHINLGLRGRDVFDLELTSDVYSTKVTVNNVNGTYKYNNNKVTIRRNDCNNYNYREDSANIYAQTGKYEDNSYEQKVRESDIDVKNTNANKESYTNTGLAIEVTYKITVKNASNTAGTATKITDYYDKKYEFVGAYSDSSCEDDKKLITNDAGSGTGYKSIEIITPETTLNQSDKMDIYVVYKLNDPVELFNDSKSYVNGKLATYNMAEIKAYKTIGTGNEATRGLLDKDSAPGSATTEKVRLAPNLIGTQTTIEYYFGGNDLSKLKYEDDTYATPTLYFVKDGNERKITGTVFEDKTTTDENTRIKTGNGKLDEGEVGVYGATVELIEQVEDGIIRYETTSNKDGTFEFSGFLPGDYIIKYHYGDTTNTVLLHQSDDNTVNNKSYNGEDFQATNNGLNASEANKPNPSLNTTPNYWYLYNEDVGISTAIDDKSRRIEVSNTVANFSDYKMEVLNNMKAGKDEENCKVVNIKTGEITTVNDIIKETNMNANTQSIFFAVEKTELSGSEIQEKTSFGNYEVTQMNFGIAEIPVTTIDLRKTIKAFTITDSVGQNVIAKLEFNSEGKPVTKGNVTAAEFVGGNYWAQIEDEKLQGARLEITFNIREEITNELNFDGTSSKIAHITGLVDFVSNNLSYNQELGDNNLYWELTDYNAVENSLEEMKFGSDDPPKGTVDPDGNIYNVILKAKESNPLLLATEGTVNVPITLEKVLTSTETIEGIVADVADINYSNTVEIIGFEYQTTEIEQPDGTKKSEFLRDRIRTKEGYIILPGKQYDSASSEELIITPPTGDSSISITYYIIAVISLVVLTVGVFGIKKFVIKK